MTRKTALKTIALLAATICGGKKLRAEPKTNLPYLVVTDFSEFKLAIDFNLDAYDSIQVSSGGKTKTINTKELFDAL